jgi:hypothetical protein
MKAGEHHNGQRVVWRPNEGPQTEFLACPARECLVGGSLGGGKSDSLLAAALSQTGNRAHRAIIFRRTFPQTRDLVARSHEIFSPLGARFNVQTSSWTFPSGAKVEFGFLDSDADRFRYEGRQFNFIGWDELTSWPNDTAYIFLMSRLRKVKDSGLRLEVRATTTAGGVGHHWVKARFAIPDDGSASECIDPATGYRRVFIPAKIADNPYLLGTDYERTLQSLPEASRAARLHGFWNVFEGAVFSEWNPSVHVCEAFTVPASWKKWRAADDGFSNPFACLWLIWDKDVTDTIFVVREIYQSKLTPTSAASLILETDGTLANGEWKGVIDSSAFADTGMGARGDAMNKLGCRWTPCEKYPGSRLAGLSAIHQRLATREDGSVGLKVFRGCCPNLVRTLPSLVYDMARPEEIDSGCEDHAVDALRYGLLWQPIRGRRYKVGGA